MTAVVRCRWIGPFLLTALFARALAAQEIGQRVVVIHDRAAIKAGPAVVDQLDRGEVLTVFNSKVTWLLVSRGHAGWLDQQDVVPLEKALDHFNAALSQNPRDAGARAARAMILLQTGKPDEALAEASAAVGLNSQLVQAYVVHSAAACAKRDFAAAHADAQIAIRLAPAAPAGYAASAAVWNEERQFEKAVADYSTAIERDHTNAHLYLRRGQARLASPQVDQWKSAVHDFGEAYRLSDYDPWCQHEARLARAQAFEKQGRVDEAIDELTDLLRENRDDVPALIVRGTVYGQHRQYDKSLLDLDAAVWLDGKNPRAYLARAAIRNRQYNLRGALRDLDTALQLEPNSAEAFLLRGDAHAKARQWDEAIAAYDRAIALDPRRVDAYLHRADVHGAKGDAKRALADRTQAHQIDPAQAVVPAEIKAADSSLVPGKKRFMDIQRE